MQLRNLLLLLLVSFSATLLGQKNTCNSSKAYLGINYSLVSSEKASLLGFDNRFGDYITKVIKNTPADKAGLQIFDYIYGIDDKRVSSNEKLSKILNAYKPGDKMSVHYYRRGKPFAAEVVLGDKSNAYGKYSASNAFLGVSQHSGYDGSIKGVKVNIISNSTAAAMGLKKGDIIQSINGYSMIDWTDITTAIEGMTPGQEIVVAYERNGQLSRAEMPVKSIQDTRNYSCSTEKKKEKAFLGINYDDISAEKAKKLNFDNHYGNYITSVYNNTAAERAGLKPFDYLYGVDKAVFDKMQKIGGVLSQYMPDDKVQLLVVRAGKKIKLNTTLGRKSDKKNIGKDKCQKAFFGISPGHKKSENGVLVNIVSGSTAAALGLEDKAVIAMIDGHPIWDWTDVTTAINQLDAGDKISVVYYQNGTKKAANGLIKSYCDKNKDKRRSSIENFGREVEAWANVSASDYLEEGDPVDINNVDLILSDLSTAEVEGMDYQTGANNLRLDFLTIAPDPESGKFLLEFNLRNTELLMVRLHNGAGREIYSYQMENFSGRFSDTVNISQNGTGNYFIEIQHGNRHISKKITLAAM